MWYKELQNSHWKNRRYAFYHYDKTCDKRPDRPRLRVPSGEKAMRRKAEAAFDLDGILRSIRRAELDSGGAAAIVNALKERGLIDIGAVPAGKGSVPFTDFYRTSGTMIKALT